MEIPSNYVRNLLVMIIGIFRMNRIYNLANILILPTADYRDCVQNDGIMEIPTRQLPKISCANAENLSIIWRRSTLVYALQTHWLGDFWRSLSTTLILPTTDSRCRWYTGTVDQISNGNYDHLWNWQSPYSYFEQQLYNVLSGPIILGISQHYEEDCDYHSKFMVYESFEFDGRDSRSLTFRSS